MLISLKNKLKGKDCMKMFCRDLKVHVTKIINYKKRKEIIPLINEEKIIHHRQKMSNIQKYKKRFSIDDNNKK